MGDKLDELYYDNSDDVEEEDEDPFFQDGDDPLRGEVDTWADIAQMAEEDRLEELRTSVRRILDAPQNESPSIRRFRGDYLVFTDEVFAALEDPAGVLQSYLSLMRGRESWLTTRRSADTSYLDGYEEEARFKAFMAEGRAEMGFQILKLRGMELPQPFSQAETFAEGRKLLLQTVLSASS